MLQPLAKESGRVRGAAADKDRPHERHLPPSGEQKGMWLLGVAIEYIQPSSLSTLTLDRLCCTAGESPPAGRTVRAGSRVAGEYSPARCTRDKPEAGEYSSASYLHPTANLLLLLTQWLGSTPRNQPLAMNRKEISRIGGGICSRHSTCHHSMAFFRRVCL